MSQPTRARETRPIEQHGAIGDLRTLALLDDQGTVDWLCWPRFDSPSIFGSLLDPHGGHWSLGPCDATGEAVEVTTRQLYLPDTNVLLTRFENADGIVEVQDFMMVTGPRTLVREITGIRGSMMMSSQCAPAPNYGRACATFSQSNDRILELELGAEHGGETIELASSVDLTVREGCASARFEITEGTNARFLLGPDASGIDASHDLCQETIEFWRAWIDQSTYNGRWREVVSRSALTLKLLTHSDSGGVLAAGTTSLPEVEGGSRNWDYRYVWIRDAAFTLYAFNELGFTSEAEHFGRWLEARIDECAPDDGAPLSPLYDLDGNRDIDEYVLDHWQGFRHSRPVRVGNAASSQLQLDIYGEIIDSLYLSDKYGSGLSADHWSQLRTIVDWVCENWERPDDGMWEFRSGPQRFTSSLLMSWVAVERAMRMARHRGRPADIERWRKERDRMHETLMERGYSSEAGAFTQVLDGDALDSSLLLLPMMKFISPTDPKWISTLDAIGDRLAHDALVDRYDLDASDDGVEGNEGSFTICSFWYVEALARSGRMDRARLLFDKLLTYATPLGQFSEEIGPNGRQLGNFPQAFSHLALISAATYLDEVLDD